MTIDIYENLLFRVTYYAPDKKKKQVCFFGSKRPFDSDDGNNLYEFVERCFWGWIEKAGRSEEYLDECFIYKIEIVDKSSLLFAFEH